MAQPCLTLCDPMDCSPPGPFVHGDSPGKDTGVGCLHGIFPTQRENPGLPHHRQILYRLSDQGSPRILEWVARRGLVFMEPLQKIRSSIQIPWLRNESGGTKICLLNEWAYA